MSLNGFLPLMFEYSSSSRAWSMPRKMVRSSGPVRTLALPLALTRWMSWIGTGSMTSTSPDSSAATRVAAEAIGVKIDLLQIMLGLAPPVRIDLEHGLHAGLMAFDEEGAGAVLVQRGVARRGCRGRRRRDRVVFLAPFLVHDEPAVPLRDQDGIGRVEHHVDRVVVDLDELGIGRNVGEEVRTRGAHAFGGKDHVVGGEGIAVVEFDAFAQMEAPVGRLQGFPAFRQRRHDLQILVAGDQALIDMGMMGDGRGFLERIGIERFEVALVGVAQGLA